MIPAFRGAHFSSLGCSFILGGFASAAIVFVGLSIQGLFFTCVTPFMKLRQPPHYDFEISLRNYYSLSISVLLRHEHVPFLGSCDYFI